jgi:hypothetical protein
VRHPDVFKAHRKDPFRSIDGHRVKHVAAPVEGEVGLVVLYDVLNLEFHPKSPERIWISEVVGEKSRLHSSVFPEGDLSEMAC